jgi:adenine-specific DNA-methyltransferase
MSKQVITKMGKRKSKNKYGQYFTPEAVAEFMLSLTSKKKKDKVLEPSCGQGVFLDILEKKGYTDFKGFEVDKTLTSKSNKIIYESFVSYEFNEKYDLIIGNPPYIRWSNLEAELKVELESNILWKKHFNSLCDYLYIFILKSIELLNEKGELIFICPEYWLNTTHSLGLRNYMMQNGYFESIYYFNETPIFKNVTVSFIIFKYVKSKKRVQTIDYFKFDRTLKLNADTLSQIVNHCDKQTINQFNINERWIFAEEKSNTIIINLEKNCRSKSSTLFEDDTNSNIRTIGEICDIGNGMVSGLDKAFQLKENILNELNDIELSCLIKVAKAKDLDSFFNNGIHHYFLIPSGLTEEEFTFNYPHLKDVLSGYIDELNNRYNYSRDIKYWEWVFLRNFNLFQKKSNRILVPCKERVSNKDYFRFSLVNSDIVPTQDVTGLLLKESTKESVEYVTAYLNNSRVFTWLCHKGIIKGNIVEFSEKPISSIPYRHINWNDPNEVEIHNQITLQTKSYIKTKKGLHLNSIKSLFDKLLS